MDEIREGQEIWIKAKVIAYRPDTKKVCAMVCSHLGSVRDDWFEEGQYTLFPKPTPTLTAEEIERIIEDSQLYLLASNRKYSYGGNLPEKETKQLASTLSGKIAKEGDWIKPNDGNCFVCGEMTDSLIGNPAKWSIFLPHIDGQGKHRHYHIGCLYPILKEHAQKNGGEKEKTKEIGKLDESCIYTQGALVIKINELVEAVNKLTSAQKKD